MYELRLFALEQLSAMGGNLFLCDPHRIIVDGPTTLRGRTLDSRDIRSGMALIAAALAAKGVSTVLEIETVERGYAGLVERLKELGADVERTTKGRRHKAQGKSEERAGARHRSLQETLHHDDCEERSWRC